METEREQTDEAAGLSSLADESRAEQGRRAYAFRVVVVVVARTVSDAYSYGHTLYRASGARGRPEPRS